jgi:ubiquinone/menaquinone biosynthesis C-methylase UbiE
MDRQYFRNNLIQCFQNPVQVDGNFLFFSGTSGKERQQQTNDVFSDKWKRYEKSSEAERLYQYQKKWYLELYGFGSEDNLAHFLSTKSVILDAGCGLGYKAAWFAELAPRSLVIGMDFSHSAKQAAQVYGKLQNLFFIQGDIANTGMTRESCDYTSCDQVIMHTEDPEATFTELARITARSNGELACYFYAKKALPRELIDDYFRVKCSSMSSAELWEMAEQLTELGKRLSSLNATFECPQIPALGIKGGRMDVQRFIYWNFLKCFWNETLGVDTSIVTNYDWYSPSNARRFSTQEVENIILNNKMKINFFHTEEAAYSGRFSHA